MLAGRSPSIIDGSAAGEDQQDKQLQKTSETNIPPAVSSTAEPRGEGVSASPKAGNRQGPFKLGKRQRIKQVEWTIQEISHKLQIYEPGQPLLSPEFTVVLDDTSAIHTSGGKAGGVRKHRVLKNARLALLENSK